MENMSEFFVAMLSAIADFLGSDPVIYVFGLVCLCMIVKIIKNIISI